MKREISAVRLRRERSVERSQNQIWRIAIVMILLLCAFAPSRAQITINTTGSFTLTDTSWFESQDLTVIAKYDTIPCIILYCDTTNYIITSKNDTFNDLNARWTKAYEVRSITKGQIPCPDQSYTYGCIVYHYGNVYSHLKYINQDKNEIPGSWIIWDSKPIK